MSFSYLISGTFPDYGRSVSRHGKFVTKVNVRIASRDEVKKIMSFDGDFAANYILMRGAIYGQIPEYRILQKSFWRNTMPWSSAAAPNRPAR